MNHIRTALAAIAVLALFVGAGATVSADDSRNNAAPGDEAGPPSDLPGPVPDFVGSILDTVQQFVDGVLEGALGPAVSGEASSAMTAARSPSGG